MQKNIYVFSNFITMINFFIPNKKQKLNYTYVNYIGLIFFFLIVISFICLYGFVTNIFKDFVLSISLFFIFLGLSFALYFIKDRFYITYKNNLFINDRLRTLIDSYGLYEMKDEIKVVSMVQFKIHNDKVEIFFPIGANSYSQKFRDLKVSLSDILRMKCIDVEDILGSITYTFSNDIDSINIFNKKNFKSSVNGVRLNSELIWDFDKQPHALITGATGSGKTYFLSYLLQVLNEQDADIKILDPKMSDLYQIGQYLNFNVAYSINQVDKILRETIEELESRKKYIIENSKGFGCSYKDYGFKPLFIFFDEVGAFMARANLEDSKVAKSVQSRLNNIILMGRQLGIFAVLCTQRPDAKNIGGDLRDQLSLRVALGMMSSDGYSMVFGSEFRNLKLIESGKGAGFIYLDGVTLEPKHFKTPIMSQMFFN
jgi:S-DNA-T family DNA segregation ATPase FtsK/SpoIIIE